MQKTTDVSELFSWDNALPYQPIVLKDLRQGLELGLAEAA